MMSKGSLLIEVGAGEVIDKITILKIKAERMTDPAKLKNVNHELSVLSAACAQNLAATPELARLETELQAVNEALWVIEDDIRLKERAQAFDDGFVQLARSVYIENDERARIKKAINMQLGSTYVEEKSYQDYRATPAG